MDENRDTEMALCLDALAESQEKSEEYDEDSKWEKIEDIEMHTNSSDISREDNDMITNNSLEPK